MVAGAGADDPGDPRLAGGDPALQGQGRSAGSGEGVLGGGGQAGPGRRDHDGADAHRGTAAAHGPGPHRANGSAGRLRVAGLRVLPSGPRAQPGGSAGDEGPGAGRAAARRRPGCRAGAREK